MFGVYLEKDLNVPVSLWIQVNIVNMIEMVTNFGIFHYIDQYIYIMDPGFGFMIVIAIAVLCAIVYVSIATKRYRYYYR